MTVKKTKKGMALAGTLILLTIVLMMSTLMMTLTLFATQTVSASSQALDDRIVLDEIGHRFLDYKADYKAFLKYYVDKYPGKVKYYGADTNPSETPTNIIKGNIDGMKLVISVDKATNSQTLNVSTQKASRQLLKITCSLQHDTATGVVSAKLKSWNYGN